MRAALFLVTGLLLAAVPAAAQYQPPREGGNAAAVRDAANRHYRLGLNYFAGEYWSEAVREFSRATELDDRFALAFYGLGRAHIGLKNFVPAVAALTQCRALFLDVAASATSDAFSRNQRRQEQIMELRDSLRELSGGPQTASRQRTIENVQDQLHELEQAPSFNANLTARAPAFVTLSLGSAYFRTEDFANAEEYFLEAAEANPKMGEAHNNLAVVYYEMGRYDEANKRVKLAEKYGYRVSPLFKEALKTAQLPSR